MDPKKIKRSNRKNYREAQNHFDELDLQAAKFEEAQEVLENKVWPVEQDEVVNHDIHKNPSKRQDRSDWEGRDDFNQHIRQENEHQIEASKLRSRRHGKEIERTLKHQKEHNQKPKEQGGDQRKAG